MFASATSVGAISYMDIEGFRYKRDVLFCYDLKLPPDFVPNNEGKHSHLAEQKLDPNHMLYFAVLYKWYSSMKIFNESSTNSCRWRG